MPKGGVPKFISGIAITQVATGIGVLDRIVVGKTAAAAINVFDATSGTTDQIASLKGNIAEGTYEFGARFEKGIRVETLAASDITVVTSEQN